MSFGTIPLSPDDKPDSFVLLSMYEKLESENAKLRKLCIDMWLDLRKQLTPPWLDEYEQRMRELGVEVDG